MFKFVNYYHPIVLLASALIIVFSQAAHGINASPHPITETQPDGAKINVFIRGDHFFHWYEDEKGYKVLHDKGRYVYAVLDPSGKTVASDLEVGKVNPEEEGLSRNLQVDDAQFRQKVAENNRRIFTDMAKSGEIAKATPLGTLKNLVIPIRFSNHLARTLPTQSEMNTLFNAVGGHATLAPTGSIRDVYLENSYNQFTLDSTVLNWVNVTQTEQYYANGVSGDSTLWEALVQALNAVDASVNFNDFDQDNDDWIDALAFLHSSYGAEWGGTDSAGVASADRIWSHRWNISPVWTSAEGVRVSAYHISPALWGTSGSQIGRIGVIAHETGHFFGLPDLYDTSKPGDGIGSWGMMANSWGFDGSQLHPPHFCAWSKINLGWTTPTILTTEGTYNISQWATNNQVYRINDNFPSNEYLLIENRQAAGIETAIPQGGLAVFHIDDNAQFSTQGYPGQTGWPENGNHYRVALLQADGDYDLEKGQNRGDSGDIYRSGGQDVLGPNTVPSTDRYQGGNIGTTGVQFSNISASGAIMSFQLEFDVPGIGEGEGEGEQTACTTLLFEDFEQSFPTWTNIDNDGLTDFNGRPAAWFWMNLDSQLVAASSSWFTVVGTSDNWLITPPLNLGEGGDISWTAFSYQGSPYQDSYEVRISTTGNSMADFLALPALFTIAEENTSPTTRSVDLGAAGYSNQQVYIAFRHNSLDNNLLLLDDILVRNCEVVGGENCVNAPYTFGDPCYEEVIIGDAGCCDVEWDTVCQDSYDVCAAEGEGEGEGETPEPLIIGQEPEDLSVLQGENASFAVGSVSGGTEPYMYEWFFTQAKAVSGVSNVTGADTETLEITGVNMGGNVNAGGYYCVITDSAGVPQSVQSETATLSVTPLLQIGTQPINTIVEEGGNTELTVGNVSGGTPPYFYEWFFTQSKDVSGVNNVTGVNTSTLTISGANTGGNDNRGQYYCVVSDSALSPQSIQSNTVTLTILEPLGACCFADGSCFEVIEGNCTSAGGNFQGDNTTCLAAACPQPEGEGEIFLDHTADQNGNNIISLSELLRVIQIFNIGSLSCLLGSEDGFFPGNNGDTSCSPHSSDYNPQNWVIALGELLRMIQFFNLGGYYSCPSNGTEDGFCPVPVL